MKREDSRTWVPAQRPYAPRFLTMYTLSMQCMYRDVSPSSKIRLEIRMKSGHLPWAKKNGLTKTSILKNFSMSIGPPKRTSSLYRVSRIARPDRSLLIDMHRGCCHWKAPFASRTEILRNATVCLFVTLYFSQLKTLMQAESLRYPLQELERLLKKILPTDEQLGRQRRV